MLHRPTRASRARRAGWNLVDQVLSAATNVALSVIIARNVSATDFGSFAVAFLMFTLMIGVSRAVVGLPWGIRHGAASPREHHAIAGAGLGASLVVSLPASLGLIAVAAILGARGDQSLAPTLTVLALVLPALVLQDTCRMAFFAWARPAMATLIDLVWAVGQLGLVAAAISVGAVSAPVMVGAWGAAAAVSAGLGVLVLRSLPRPRRAFVWHRGCRDISHPLLVEYALRTGTFSGATLVIGLSLGLGDIGALRAAQMLLGPLTILTVATATFGIPEVARHGIPKRPLRLAAMVSAAAVVVSVAYSGALLLLAPTVGPSLLGDTWPGTAALLLPVAAASTIGAALLGPSILLYGLGLTRRTVRLVAVLAAVGVTFMVAGAAVAGISGMAWGMAVAHVVVIPLWFLTLQAELRRLALADPAPTQRSAPPVHANVPDDLRTADPYGPRAE